MKHAHLVIVLSAFFLYRLGSAIGATPDTWPSSQSQSLSSPDPYLLVAVEVSTPEEVAFMQTLPGFLLDDEIRHGTIQIVLKASNLHLIEEVGLTLTVQHHDVGSLLDYEKAHMAANRPVDPQAPFLPRLTSVTGSRKIYPGDLAWYSTFRNFEEIEARLQVMQADNPGLVRLESIGHGYENLSGDPMAPVYRDIWAIRIGYGTESATLVTGTQHAREWIAAMTSMYIVDQLIYEYREGVPGTVDLLNNHEVIVIPVTNPDGYAFTHSYGVDVPEGESGCNLGSAPSPEDLALYARLFRKNRNSYYRDEYCAEEPSPCSFVDIECCMGVNLNRNWGHTFLREMYGGLLACTYTGNSGLWEFSENETAAMRDLFLLNPQINTTLDLHSYTQLIIRPYMYLPSPSPDEDLLRAQAEHMSDLIFPVHRSYYHPENPYSARGTSVDYFYFSGVTNSFAFELRPDTLPLGTPIEYGFFLDPSEIVPTGEEIWPAVYFLFTLGAHELHVDTDSDGVVDWFDNCYLEPNIDQADCDEDGAGDVCDDDICLDFCGDVVSPVAGSPLFFYNGIDLVYYPGPTGRSITTQYCASGPAGVDPREEGEHDVQLRWCDCDPWGTDEPTLCVDWNCPQEAATNRYVHFEHSGWHPATYDKSTAPIDTGPEPSEAALDAAIEDIIPHLPPPEPGEEEVIPVGTDLIYDPTAECDRNNEWSFWDFEEGVFDLPSHGWYTRHCAPQSIFYDDPVSRSGITAESVGWLWKDELWWRSETAGWPVLPDKSMSSRSQTWWGYLWLRPEVDDTGGSGRTIDEMNRYQEFRVPEEGGRSRRIPGKLDEILSYEASLIAAPKRLADVSSPVATTLVQVGKPRMGLHAIPPELRDAAAEYAYPAGAVGADSAISGLLVTFIDEGSLAIEDFGYSRPALPGTDDRTDYSATSVSVPDTIRFASSHVSWSSNTGQLDVVVANEGIAVYGGSRGDGSFSDSLWIGWFSGLDAAGVPYFTWNVMPTTSQAPEPRADAGLVHDHAHDRLLLVGGTRTDGTVANDLWAYDLASGNGWSLVSDKFLSLSGMTVMQYADQVFMAGGQADKGALSSQLYRFDLDSLTPMVVGDIIDGPGPRHEMSFAFEPTAAGRILAYGGMDEGQMWSHGLWEYDIATGEWEELVEGCAGRLCPGQSGQGLMVASRDVDGVGLYATGSGTGDLYFTVDRDTGFWTGNTRTNGPPGPMDCDLDGTVDVETTRVCRSSDDWYAEVGRLTCVEPGTGELACSAPPTTPKELHATWSPSGWETIQDFDPKHDEYTWVLTNSGLYTLAKWPGSGGGVIEVDREDLLVHMVGPWSCSLSDWGMDLHVSGDVAFVGSWKGIHAFSLEEPWDPYEVAFTRMDLPVTAMTSLGNLLYVAQGDDVVVLDGSDPSALVEVGRTSLGGSVMNLDIESEDRKIVALTPLELVLLDAMPNPILPVFSDSIALIGWAFEDMRVDGPWIYLSGWWTQSFHDSREDGLQRMGWHDLREWVEGSRMGGWAAERIDEHLDRYEMWVEAPY